MTTYINPKEFNPTELDSVRSLSENGQEGEIIVGRKEAQKVFSRFEAWQKASKVKYYYGGNMVSYFHNMIERGFNELTIDGRKMRLHKAGNFNEGFDISYKNVETKNYLKMVFGVE